MTAVMNRRVLLVEPDRRAALRLEALVAAAGDRVVSRATHPRHVLAKAAAFQPEIALLDLDMPEAREAALAIRTVGEIPIVWIIGDTDSFAPVRADGPCVRRDVGVPELALTIELTSRGVDPDLAEAPTAARLSSASTRR